MLYIREKTLTTAVGGVIFFSGLIGDRSNGNEHFIMLINLEIDFIVLMNDLLWEVLLAPNLQKYFTSKSD